MNIYHVCMYVCMYVCMRNYYDGNLQGDSGAMSECMTPQWFKEHQAQAHIDTGLFPDNCAAVPLSISAWEEVLYVCIALGFCGVFFCTLPFLLSVAVYYHYYYHSVLLYGVVAVVVAASYLLPWDCWPPAFRCGWMMKIVCKYFSYRMIIEAPREAYTSAGYDITV